MKHVLPDWPMIYAVVSLSCLLVFSLSTIIMHIVNVAIGVRVPWYLSHFATGPTFWMWTLGLVGLAIGAVTMARAMQLCLPASRSRSIAVVLLILMGIGTVIMAAFPSDEYNPFSVQSMIHMGAAIPTFFAMCGGVVATAWACRQDASWRLLGSLGLALAFPVLVAVGVFIMAMQNEHPTVGAAERFIVYAVILWFTMISGKAVRLSGQGRLPGRTPITA